MFITTSSTSVLPSGTASTAWLPRPAHATAPALDALERDEAAWTGRSVTAVRNGEGGGLLWTPLHGADGDGGSHNGGNGRRDGGDGGDSNHGSSSNNHHRILGYSVRNPEDIGLDRNVPPPPPLHVSRARLAAAAAAGAGAAAGDDSDMYMEGSVMSMGTGTVPRNSSSGRMPPPPPVMVRGGSSVGGGGTSSRSVVGRSSRNAAAGSSAGRVRRVVPAGRARRTSGRFSTGSATSAAAAGVAVDTSELTADSEVAVRQPRSRRARTTTTPRGAAAASSSSSSASAAMASARRRVVAARRGRERAEEAAAASAEEGLQRLWQDDQDTTQEMEVDHDRNDDQGSPPTSPAYSPISPVYSPSSDTS